MRKASRPAAGFSKLCRRGIFCSNSPVRGVLPSLLCLCLFSAAVQRVRAADRRIAQRGTVPQTSVDPRPIRLPVIDGTDIRFARLSTAEGLSQTRVAQIVQDDQGFMWFGTQYGLNRYDGYTFKVFVHDARGPNSLSGVFIGALFKDRDGALWVGCDEFLNKFGPATETFTRYPVPFVTHISQDTAGTLWLATGTGLYRLDPATGQIRQYSHDPSDPSSLSSNDVKSSGEDKEGRFWVANREGLDEFDRRTGKVTLRVPLREPLPEFSFYEDRFGVFWIVHASGNGLAVLDRKTNTLTHYSFYEREPPSTAVTGVVAMLEDKNGNLWLATLGDGLLKFDRERRRFIRYRNDPADPESLAQDSVISLLVDREGNIWAGLGGSGPTRFASTPPTFQQFPHHRGNPNDNGDTFVGAIFEDRQGVLWTGTREALNRIDRKARRRIPYRTAEPGIPSDVISIVEDRPGALWVGTFNHGLLRFDQRTGRFKTYRHNATDPYSLSNDIVPRILVDHKGTLWAATWDGLDRFDPATERFTTYKLDPHSRNLFYLELVEDREGALWLGTHSSGLHRFDPATGQFTIYRHDMNRPGTLSDNRVNSVYFDRSGTMWVGTQNGLNKLDPKTGRFTVFTQRDGLSGNAVGCILEDDHGDLWMSTNSGVARFNSERRTVKNYSTADGLPGPDLTGWGACFKSRTGEMFFGGFSGATAFHPDQVVGTSYTPPIVLTDFRLSGNPVEIGSRSPLQKSISCISDLILSHQQNVFSLTFSALSYSNPATNRYRYNLEGLDHEWNEVGSDRRQATYTTLPAGRYTFRAQGATNSSAWSEPGVALRIEILPPWWSSWWFRATCAALILFSVSSACHYRLRGIKQRSEQLVLMNAKLEAQIGERKQAEVAMHRAQAELAHVTRVITVGEMTAAIAHEVNQPLAAVVTNAGACLRWIFGPTPDLEEARLALGRIVKDGNRAGEVIGRIRDLVKKSPPRKDRLDINETILEISLLTDAEVRRNRVSFQTRLSRDLPRILGDRIQLQQVILNLIKNAVDAMSTVSDGPRELLVSSERDESKGVLVAVRDSGPGFSREALAHLFEAFYTTKPEGMGLGLAISRSIIEAHGGRLWATPNQPHGAVFQFTLPADGDRMP